MALTKEQFDEKEYEILKAEFKQIVECLGWYADFGRKLKSGEIDRHPMFDHRMEDYHQDQGQRAAQLLSRLIPEYDPKDDPEMPDFKDALVKEEPSEGYIKGPNDGTGCCMNELRDWNGGCVSCGDPAL